MHACTEHARAQEAVSGRTTDLQRPEPQPAPCDHERSSRRQPVSIAHEACRCERVDAVGEQLLLMTITFYVRAAEALCAVVGLGLEFQLDHPSAYSVFAWDGFPCFFFSLVLAAVWNPPALGLLPGYSNARQKNNGSSAPTAPDGRPR